VAKIIAYLNEMQAPSKQWNRLKLVVVGPENVGKTHLIHCLQKRDYPKNISTDGIEVEPMLLTKRIKLLIYDFGGQEVFYPTHQFFLTDRSLYVVVFDLITADQNRVEYWLKVCSLLSSRSRFFRS
jgi:internalin A